MLDEEDSVRATDIECDVAANDISFFNVCCLGFQAYSGSEGIFVRSDDPTAGLARGKVLIEGLLGMADGLMLGLERDALLTAGLLISSGDLMLGWERGELLDLNSLYKEM